MEFKELTKFIDKLKDGNYGEWAKQPEDADGSKEHPFLLGFVIYTKDVYKLVDEIIKIDDKHPEYKFSEYNEEIEKLLKAANVKNVDSLDINKLDIKSCCVILYALLRADRFAEGLLLNYLKSGFVKKVLERVKELDA